MKKPTEYDARLRVVSEALDKVEAPGDYCTMGVYAAFPLPGLVVDRVGDVSVPLTDASAQALIAASHLAPFGHGEQTLVDTQVRNTWELSANQFRLENPAFSAFVKDQIAEACRVPLGIHASVEFEAKLYKLLLYEAGGKFDQHQDSEKENGMFGTLVVVLPGRFEGGELVVHHPSRASQSEDAVSGGKGSRYTSTFDAATMDPFALKYAAFYGDCPHEVRAVTKGYRLCLTYNLVVASSTMSDVADPQFGSNHVLYETLKTAMDQFFCEDGADKAKRQRLDGDGSEASVGFDVTNPETHRQCKLVYVLTHKYTDANLCFGNLKNRDAAVASSLAHYCGTSDGALGLYLCKINYLFSWHGDEGTMYRSDNDSEDDEDDEDDSSDGQGRGDITRSLELLRPLVQYDKDDAVSVDASGKLPPFVKGDLKAEVVPCGVFERKGFEFDGENSSEYTGNEGATSDRWYGSAALVVAPIRLGADWSLQCNPPDALLKQWFASVDSKPVHARLIAHAFGRFALNWSTTSALGLRILETAVKMDEITATCAVLSAFKRFDFQPKMRELMASFDSDRRAKTVKFLVRRWRANSEYAEPNWFNLTASMLDGISDSDTVALVLGAVGTVPVVQLDENEDLSLSEKETTPEEFARVLEVFAFKSQEAVKALLESSRLRSVVLAGVPAIEMLLAATRDQPDKGAVVLACANQVLDLLTRNLWAIRNLSYKKRFGCPSFYDCACHALRPFLSSCDEATTFDKRNVDHLTRQLELADLLDRFSMEPSSDGAQSKVVLKKYESPLFKRAQAAIAKLQDLANEFVRVAVLHGSGVSRVE